MKKVEKKYLPIFKNKTSVEPKFSKLNTIVNIVFNCIAIPLLIIAFLSCFVIFNSKRQKTVPAFFGYSIVQILSDSMEASGFYEGDTVVIESINPTALHVGDVIAFYRYDNFISSSDFDMNLSQPYVSAEGANREVKFSFSKLFGFQSKEICEAAKADSLIYFHKIRSIMIDNNGELWFKTYGTSKLEDDVFWINQDYVIGTYVNASEGTISTLNFITSKTGVACIVIIPMVLLAFYLLLEFLKDLEYAKLEKALLAKEIKLTNPICVKKKIGFKLKPKTKYILLTYASIEEKQQYINLLWRKGEIPIDIIKYYKRKGLYLNEVRKYEQLKSQCAKLIAEGKPETKVLASFKQASKELEDKIANLEQKLKYLKSIALPTPVTENAIVENDDKLKVLKLSKSALINSEEEEKSEEIKKEKKSDEKEKVKIAEESKKQSKKVNKNKENISNKKSDSVKKNSNLDQKKIDTKNEINKKSDKD